MRLLDELARLSRSGASSGFVALANRLDSFEERVETQRKFRDLEDGSLEERSLRNLAASYEALPVVALPEFLHPHDPTRVPPPPESGVRLSKDYFGLKARVSEKRCGICRAYGHNVRTCSVAEEVELPLHLVSKK